MQTDILINQIVMFRLLYEISQQVCAAQYLCATKVLKFFGTKKYLTKNLSKN